VAFQSPSARNLMPTCDPLGSECREIEIGFDEETARAEAARCLRCGLICYERPPEAFAKGRELLPEAPNR